MESWYVVLYDGKGDKCGGYNCRDALDGLSSLRHEHKNSIFTYAAAACFYLKLRDFRDDQLPVRQWFLEID